MHDLLQEYIIYSVLNGSTFLLTRVAGVQYTISEVPSGVTLQYAVTAVDSQGRKGDQSSVVQITGINMTCKILFRKKNMQGT